MIPQPVWLGTPLLKDTSDLRSLCLAPGQFRLWGSAVGHYYRQSYTWKPCRVPRWAGWRLLSNLVTERSKVELGSVSPVPDQLFPS